MEITIGLDTGKVTGLSVAEYQSGFFPTLVEVTSMPIHRAMSYVLNLHNEAKAKGDVVLVILEDARQRTWFGKIEQVIYRKFQGNMPLTPKERSIYKGLLLGAGSVQRDCTIWEDFLTDHGIAFVMEKPKAGSTKRDANFFKRLTNWPKKTNEHSRDSGMLICGRSLTWVRAKLR